jgi:hypothetical protein
MNLYDWADSLMYGILPGGVKLGTNLPTYLQSQIPEQLASSGYYKGIYDAGYSQGTATPINISQPNISGGSIGSFLSGMGTTGLIVLGVLVYLLIKK